MSTQEDGNQSIEDYLKKLREHKGGMFEVKVLKHGGSVRAIAATAASQILHTMKNLNRTTITFQRRILPELFSTKALDKPKSGRAPTLKASVREHLRGRGIQVVYAGGLIDFIKIEPKMNPNI